MSNVVAIVQARMGSTRLPGKVLASLEGQPMIEHVLRRCAQIRLVDAVIVAIPDTHQDDPLAHLLGTRRYPIFRGPEEDVLERYRQAAEAFRADVVVRITADCPFVDPDVSDHVITTFLQGRADYVSNTVERTYPRGLDTEVFTIDALRRAAREAHDPADREHVTRYIWRNPTKYRQVQVKAQGDFSHLRWTVDTEEDLAFARALLRELRPLGHTFRWSDILQVLSLKPDLVAINAHVEQKPT